MKFCVKKRNGPARTGEFSINNKKIFTPEILFFSTNRFKPPNIAKILISDNKNNFEKPVIQISKQFVYPKEIPIETNFKKIKNNNYLVIPANNKVLKSELKDKSTILFIISNAYQLLNRPKEFVDFIIALRNKVGYQKAIYLPSVGKPSNLAIFTYLGIDLFDSISANIAARNNILLFPNGEYNKNNLNELACICPCCNKLKIKPSKMKFEDILFHNYYSFINEIKHIRNVINSGNIRNLVENRVKADPNLTAILRYLDINYYEYLEKRTPVTSNSKIIATTKESLFRPEIKRFQKRVINRYEKPKSAKVLLLLPCSAKKPYSFSKSHKFFKETIKNCTNPNVVHELIITSPLGIVPRELELTYPAANYDIPVIGVWDEDEKKLIRKLLKDFLEKNKYEKIISHLTLELNDILKDIIKKAKITCKNHPTSDESLNNLSNVLNETTKDFKKINPKNRNFEDIQGILSYQFGKNIAEKLLKDCYIKGKYPYKKIFYKNTQLGMIVFERGFISLTINGAERIFKSKKYWVEIFDDFDLVGSVFSPGVKDADTEIRIGDEVLITQKNKFIGVGVAQMNGEEMKESNHGEAVKVRHRI
jgi:archaeosine synthase